MTKEDFLKLYTKQEYDNSITLFDSEIGFSLIRDYSKNTPYYKDGKKMFIKLAILKGKLFYSIDMTKPEQRDEEPINYTITQGEEYPKKITNFFSVLDDKESFVFDENTKKIIFKPKEKSFTLNEFVEILVLNHLSDCLFLKRILDSIVESVLKLLFWLSDKHYEKIQVSIDKYHFGRDNQPAKEDEKNTEPFFKYFDISKNTIFALLLLTFLLMILSAIFPDILYTEKIWPFGEFSLSNPFVILFFFLILFSCEKFSIWLNNKIKNFFQDDKDSFQKKEINFIERLHNFQYQNKFELKLK
jgi:hypothetical protein